MRRERSQSSDRGRSPVPRWDNPSGQLPGTGIPSGIDSGLYGFSHGTSRRRDSSVPERSRVRTSESGVSAGGSRPLFDGLSSGFSRFGSEARSFRRSFWNLIWGSDFNGDGLLLVSCKKEQELLW